MAKFSNQVEQDILNLIFSGTAWTSPGTIYMGLYNGVPGDDGENTLNELTGGSYVRQPLVGADWDDPSPDGILTNVNAINFDSTGVSNHTNVDNFALWRTQTGSIAGNCLYTGPLASALSFTPGDPIDVETGQATFNMDFLSASGWSDAIATAIANHIFKNVTMSQPAGLFLNVHNADPGVNGQNGEISAITRVNTATTWNTATTDPNGHKTETNAEHQLETGSVTGGDTASHWGLWDNVAASGASNFILRAPLGQSTPFAEGVPLRFPAGNLIVKQGEGF